MKTMVYSIYDGAAINTMPYLNNRIYIKNGTPYEIPEEEGTFVYYLHLRLENIDFFAYVRLRAHLL